MSDEYLWDKSGEPDPETAKLERALGEHHWQGALPDDDAMRLAASAGSRRTHPLQLAAALIVISLLAVSVWWQIRPPAVTDPRAPTDVADAPPYNGLPYLHDVNGPWSYRFETLAGAPVIEREPTDGTLADHLLPGQRLVTDSASRARLEIGDIGSVTVEPNSRLRFETITAKAATDAEHLLYLERGTMRASIFSAPRIFQLGTPGGIAVDMGCIYSATVDDNGDTLLHVDVGVVVFEAEAREVTVPSGASTRVLIGRGPGTPVWDKAPESYRKMIAHLDEGQGTTLDVHELIQLHDVDHSLALWHLRDNPNPAVAGAALQALLILSPPPDGVTEHDLRAGNPDALSAWEASFDWSWGTGSTAKSKLGG